MNILFINPLINQENLDNIFIINSQLPPLGILYLASSLEHAGHKILVIDYCMEPYSKDHLYHILSTIDIVCITVISHNVMNVKGIIAAIKEYDFKIPVIIGGPHCSIDPIQALSTLQADICVQGDAEHIITDIINGCEQETGLDNIPGVYFWINKKIHKGKPVKSINDIDSFPFPARHLVEKYSYGELQAGLFIMSKGKITSMITSRGCPYHCRFCINNAEIMKTRVRSARNVIAEIEDIKDNYDFLYFMDDNFFIDKKRAHQILDYFIKEKPDIEFSIAGVRVDAVDAALYRKLQSAGVKVLAYGIESGNQDVLDFYQKQISLQQISSSLHLAKKNRLITVGYFMFGAPIETEKHIRDTINFAKNIPLDLPVFQPLDYLKGSKLWNEAVTDGNIMEYEPVVHSDKGRNLGNFTYQELKEWSIQAYKEFYLRPSYFLNEILLSCMRGDFRIIKNGLRNIIKSNSVLKTKYDQTIDSKMTERYYYYMNRLRWKLILFLLRHSSSYQYCHNKINKMLKREHPQKIFCIGFVKTGTTSLYKALQILGYRTVRVFDNGRLLTKDWGTYLSRLHALEQQKWKRYIERMKQSEYDAFIDFPLWYSNLYKKIDQTISDSKFILTIRDTESYIKSYVHYFQGSPWEIKSEGECKMKAVEFEKHTADVIQYFDDDPSRLLILNLFRGDGWRELCGFLNKPVPKRHFPHKNRGKYKKL